jgi:hypothetical protein
MKVPVHFHASIDRRIPLTLWKKNLGVCGDGGDYYYYYYYYYDDDDDDNDNM